MTRVFCLGMALFAGLATTTANAAIVVDGTLTSRANATAGLFDHTITLNNSGGSTTSVGTFWFAWIPGQNYMSNSPISITSPAGWTSRIIHRATGAPDGFSIQWVSGSPATNVGIGQSLTFGFTSAETPAQLAGPSAFYLNPPTMTSFVYPGAPLVGEFAQFVVSPAAVPEPSSLVLMALGGLAILARGRSWR